MSFHSSGRPSDIVERLGDLARFYRNEKPHEPLSQSECEEIASELSKAAAEIQRLRAAVDEAFIQGLDNAADIAKGERIEGILRRKVEHLRGSQNG